MSLQEIFSDRCFFCPVYTSQEMQPQLPAYMQKNCQSAAVSDTVRHGRVMILCSTLNLSASITPWRICINDLIFFHTEPSFNSVSYTHLDVYKRQIPESIVIGLHPTMVAAPGAHIIFAQIEKRRARPISPFHPAAPWRELSGNGG